MRRLAVIVASLAACAAAPAAAAPNGAALYAANCSKCHGSGGGLANLGPSLRGVGALAADFYLRTGYMPLRSPHDEPARARVLFSEPELHALIAYVAGLGRGPAVPRPQPARGSVAVGMQLFSEHCAGCHQIAAQGGYVTGARVPPLTQATPTQIAEAIRIGPYLMPRFSQRTLSNNDVDSLVRYVLYARSPDDRGGWAIGRIGPWPEGMVAWLLAGTALVGTCVVIGTRFTR